MYWISICNQSILLMAVLYIEDVTLARWVLLLESGSMLGHKSQDQCCDLGVKTNAGTPIEAGASAVAVMGVITDAFAIL